MTLTLLRSSHCPDKYPESGAFQMELGIGCTADFSWAALSRQAVVFSHPLYPYSNSLHPGALGQRHSFLRVAGNAVVTALKRGEDHPGAAVLRLYTSEKAPAAVSVTVDGGVTEAVRTDITEREKSPLTLAGGGLELTLAPGEMQTIEFWRESSYETE